MPPNRKRSCLRITLWLFAGLAGACLVLAAVSALVNSRQPTQSPVLDHLSPVDRTRLAEVLHLRQELGEGVIPGWSKAEIPLILYNEQYVFLVGYPNPPAGWEKVPSGPRRGGAWDAVPGETFQGQPYYRQRLASRDQGPENFTVRIGDRWVASLMTLDWFNISLAQQFRDGVPAPLKPVFPYPLAVNLLVGSSDRYMTEVLHETTHAYEGMQAPEKLAAAETGVAQIKARYPWDNEQFRAGWQAELDCLRDSLRAKTDGEVRALAVRFLDLRKTRRLSANLPSDLVAFERQREWEEGFAKYVELTMYGLAANPRGYSPLPEMKDDPQFHNYRDFNQLWQNEVNQVSLSNQQQDDIRFYYSGWAQSAMLDRLSPSWKARLFNKDVWLEDLLAEAVR
jgi:hypothetical protein